MSDKDVVRLSAAAQALSAIDSPKAAVGVIRLAEAARVFARQAELGAEAENAATAIRLKAEIRLAETVDQGQASGEIASAGRPKNVTDGNNIPASLPDIGVSAKGLSEAREIAGAFTLPAIDGMAEEASERGTTLSRAAVLREARSQSEDRFERMADNLVDPATRRRNGIAKGEGLLQAAHLAFDEWLPLTRTEAEMALITLTALQKKLRGKDGTRLEVVS